MIEILSSYDIMSCLECPVCFDVVQPPILLCIFGHVACNYCRSKLEKCPLCQGEFSQVRNYLAEVFVQSLFQRCKYKLYGCKSHTLKEQAMIHEKLCDFRPFECNIASRFHMCKNTPVRFGHMKCHIKKGHTMRGFQGNLGFLELDATPVQLTLKFDYKFECVYFDCFGKLFIASSEIMCSKMLYWVYIVGSDKDAELFFAKIKIENPLSGISMSWKGPVHSFRMSSKEVFSLGLGLATSAENISTLSNYFPEVKLMHWIVNFKILKRKI